MKSISEISLELKNCDLDKIDFFISAYSSDERKGVFNLVNKARKIKQDYLNELERIKSMFQYEEVFYSQGKNYIAGVDEVGRGPLAGPVVSAVVILPKNCSILGVKDSKQLSESKRNLLYDEITKKAIDFQISMEDNIVIDEINILQATIKSMETAINNLRQKPDYIITDAVNLPNVGIGQLNIEKGDEKSISVAAASIIAKVTRDRLMDEYHQIYPVYDFNKNKGYGTKEHIEAIKKYGPCPIHRKTFIRKFS